MLFLSSMPRLVVYYRSEKLIYAPNGQLVEKRPKLHARFRQGGVPEWAIQVGLEKLQFYGLPEGLLPQQQMSIFDSQQDQQTWGWTDEERVDLENFMLARMGIETNDYMLAEKTPPTPPWPSYPKLKVTARRTIGQVVAKIVETVLDGGYDPVAVAQYERITLERPEVIEALEEMQPAEQEEPEEEAIIVRA